MVYAKTYNLALDNYEAALAKEREQANQATLDFQQKEQTMKGIIRLSHWWFILVSYMAFSCRGIRCLASKRTSRPRKDLPGIQ